MRKTRRPTQEDVARRAGVSRATVSLVLNQTEGQVPIGAETRERVVRAARELSYSPNPVAQMLARGTKNHIIGFLSFDDIFLLEESDFYYRYLVGVQRVAIELNHHILLLTNNSEIYQNGMNSLLLADGVILTGANPNQDVIRRLAKDKFPFVLLGQCDGLEHEIDSVQSDHEPASYEATYHLLNLNHRSLGIVVDDLELPHHRLRLEGIQRAIREVSDARLTIITGRELETEGQFKEILQTYGITALLCAHRNFTRPAISLIHRLSLKIPTDISVVFLSDIWGVPVNSPTRVKLNRDLAGQVAMQRLMERLDGKVENYEQILIPCDLIIGETTAPIRL